MGVKLTKIHVDNNLILGHIRIRTVSAFSG